MRRRALAALTAIVLTGAMAGTAEADFFAHKGSFDGAGSVPGGAFVQPGPVAINFKGDSVVVLDTGKAAPVEQFDMAGNPKPFASKGASNSLGALPVAGRNDMAIDNSGKASEGNIYVVSQEPARAYGFDAAGNPLGGGWPVKDLGEYMCGISVDLDGDVWIADAFTGAHEYKADGTPTGVVNTASFVCQNRWTSDGAFYTNFAFGGQGFNGASIRVYDKEGNIEDLGEAKTERGFDIDPTTNDVYVNDARYVVVIDKAGATLDRFGDPEDFPPFYPGLKGSFGLAYDPATKTTYVSDSAANPPRVETFALRPPIPPKVTPGVVRQIRSTNAVIASSINPGGGETHYSIEYGPDTSYGSMALPAPDQALDGKLTQPIIVNLNGLTPGFTYHYRVVAENATERTNGPDQTLVTYAPSPGNDTCSNALVRKQTGAGALADCRAYELASADDTGGYNVSSDLVPGESPLPGFPLATGPSKLLYTLESGSIPGSGVPTSFADDPYVSTRGENGWQTEYVGIPSNGVGSSPPFASAFTAADDRLESFAFAGPELCDPCFGDGKTGIPVRRPDGVVVQGMAGSVDPGPNAHADILVRKHLSADGSHLIFGSTEPFEAGAPAAGQPAIYSRDLNAETTRVVSKDAGGANLVCLSACTTKGVAELDVSADGSRVVIGQLVGTGPSGADLWHPYLNVGGAAKSLDLAPGSTTGVLYYGMTEDGTKAFLSSDQKLTGDDHDSSVDAFRADITPTGATLTRITKGPGAIGDSDACDPTADAVHERWNALGAAANCDVVPVAGGGGLGRADGSFYFLSPEQLDSSTGAVDEPNLYLAKPDGDVAFVSTLESNSHVADVPSYRRMPIGEIKGFTAPGQLVVDANTNFVYVVDSEADTVSRFDEGGNPAPFSFAAPYISGNELKGTGKTGFGFSSLSQLAVDESGGGSDGYLYVADTNGSGGVDVFKPSGEYAGELSSAGGSCGVATSPTGVIYTLGEYIYRYKASTGDPEKFVYENSSYNSGGACLAASDADNNLYLQYGEGGPVKKIPGSEFAAESPASTTLAQGATSLASEAGSDDYLIDHGTEFDQFHSDAATFVTGVGQGLLVDSHGIAAVAGGNAYATDMNDKTVKIFGPIEIKPDPAVSSSPIAVHGVDAPDVPRSTDIQVEASGGSAAFVSSMPLTGAVVGQKRQVFRSDASGALDCASCNLTRVAPVDDSRLAAFGSSIASGGRVFFTTAEPLALRDANEKLDVYQWSKAAGYQLVSPGNSQFDNTLLSVSADGTDAYFFTRNSLVPQDRNGELMKIYDARAGGGFFVLPASVPCAASDECHGAGSVPPPPLAINTVGDKTGKGGNVKPGARKKKCGKGKVRKNGRCVKKKSKHRKKGKRGAGR